MKAVLDIQKVSKLYRLGQISSGTLSRDIETWWAKQFRKNAFDAADEEEEPEDYIWSLKDINFQVFEGEAVGIIGRNGAGKSTLLKILSRITAPTSGTIHGRGRIASLLEVGTGFHPELTGRENIFLNGAILGMRKAEIRSKFDEIVQFAGIERFVDTPVKRYSSGMYIRLAFAVAAHLESEILIVDEVLAVGDAEFQKKCLGKMGELTKAQGRTVLFVSHNMGSIETFCNRLIELEKGKLIQDTKNVVQGIQHYLKPNTHENDLIWQADDLRFNNPYFTPTKIWIGDADGEILESPIHRSEKVFLHIEGDFLQQEPLLQVGFALYDGNGNLVFWSFHTDEGRHPKGFSKLDVELPVSILNEGAYHLDLAMALYQNRWLLEPGTATASIKFELYGNFKASAYWSSRRPGIIAPVLKWKSSR